MRALVLSALLLLASLEPGGRLALDRLDPDAARFPRPYDLPCLLVMPSGGLIWYGGWPVVMSWTGYGYRDAITRERGCAGR